MLANLSSAVLVSNCVLIGSCMKTSHDPLLRLIAVFKFFKCAMLIALGVGAFRLLNQDVGAVAKHWAEALRLDPGNRFVDAALGKAAHLRPEQIKKLGLGSCVVFSRGDRVVAGETLGGVAYCGDYGQPGAGGDL